MSLGPESVRLDGHVAAVTGAASGIGRATALALASFGANVAICDRDGDQLASCATEIEGLGRQVFSAVLDVREPEPVQAWLAAAVGQLGGHLDTLVNNAGGGFRAAFVDVNDKGQDSLIRENFSSVTHCVRAAVPLMRAAGGSIVNITSIEAHRAAPDFAVYSAMKAAVANLTQSLALELGSQMIRVNCVAPDVIPTPGIGDIPVKTPLPRAGHVDDVAAAVVFLANPSLSGFITGTTIHVDGGNLASGGWHRSADGSYTT
ncbi:MAG: SDR family oxidoreductase [Acidimicrobiia bacterium]|nr:SDR family oxidoreductase [Acidimicrobiia bacterium]